MSKALITLLSNQSDTIKSAHFINSFAKENPHTEISVLTFHEYKPLTELISGITNTYCIDKESIQAIANNPLFNDAFAINIFFETLSVVQKTQWDKIINFSNDNVSSYIVSMLEGKEITGTRISAQGAPITSSGWSNYLNFVNSQRKDHVISNNSVRHHMTLIPYHTDGIKLKVNEEYSSIATQNFAKIRKSKPNCNNANIVGISLERSYSGKNIDINSLVELIDTIESSENFRAILLLSGKEEEKNIANELNYRFKNSLISINSDYSALTAVLMNIDILVSTRNNHLAIADCLDTRIIEIVPNTKEHTTAMVVNSNNYIIYQFENSNLASDVNFIINQEFEAHLPVISMSSPNKTYQIISDDYGTLNTLIRGDIDIQQELRYHIERCYHYQLLGYSNNTDLINHLKENTQKTDIDYFVATTKDELTDTVKILLAALRSLKGVKQSKSNLQNFIGYLDTLITRAKSGSITSGALGLFEGNIENISAANAEDNIKAIEDNLFTLKNELQILANILGQLVNTNKETSIHINR